MFQEYLTLILVVAASVYALVNFVKMFLPSKNGRNNHSCAGCASESCGIKKLTPIKPMPFNPNELFPF